VWCPVDGLGRFSRLYGVLGHIHPKTGYGLGVCIHRVVEGKSHRVFAVRDGAVGAGWGYEHS
jgi:hypothetical protein